METNVYSMLVYGLLGMVYYYAGLRFFHKGTDKTVNLEKGGLQLKSILLAMVGLWLTYFIFDAIIQNALSTFGLGAILLLGMEKTKENPIIDFLDGRGQATKKIERILIIVVAVILAFIFFTYLPTIPYMDYLYGFSSYIGEILLCLVGFWLIGNKDDNLTRFGYGLLGAGLLIFVIHSGIL